MLFKIYLKIRKFLLNVSYFNGFSLDTFLAQFFFEIAILRVFSSLWRRKMLTGLISL